MTIYALLLLLAGGVWWIATNRAKRGGTGLPSWLQWLAPSESKPVVSGNWQFRTMAQSSSRATKAAISHTPDTRAGLATEVRAVLDDIYSEFMAETKRLSDSHERSQAELRIEVERLRLEISRLKEQFEMPAQSGAAAPLTHHKQEVPPAPVNPYRARREAVLNDESLPMSVILDALTSPTSTQSKPVSPVKPQAHAMQVETRTSASTQSIPTTSPAFDDRYMQIFDELVKGTAPRVIAQKLGIGLKDVEFVQRVME